MSVQLIERDGKPEWAVLAYEEYLQLIEQVEILQDIRDYDRIKQAVESGEEEIIPAGLAYALMEGENPVKAWREYRRMTQHQVPFLSQIESRKRKASTRIMVGLAQALQVTVDDLV
jgi:hypothetical protein